MTLWHYDKIDEIDEINDIWRCDPGAFSGSVLYYISRDTFDGIYQQADKTAKMISGLITYLRKNDERYKQNKLKKLKKPDQP